MHNSIYCPVCGKNIKFKKICPNCGFEPARDYESYPTLGQIPENTASFPTKRLKWEKKADLARAVNEKPASESRKGFGFLLPVLIASIAVIFLLTMVFTSKQKTNKDAGKETLTTNTPVTESESKQRADKDEVAKSKETKVTAAESGNKELRIEIGSDPETLDPALNIAVDGSNMILHAFEGLTIIGEDGSIQPGQAESWEVSEDGLTWTFHLREDLKWSDGFILTADDFVFSWKRVCDPETAAPYSEVVLGMVKGYEDAVGGDRDALAVSAPDPQTFVVELSTPCLYFDRIAAFPTLVPVQEKAFPAYGEAWALSADTYVSNGPFNMTEWEAGSHITFSKNPYYWNADAIKLDKLTFVLMEDANEAYNAYQNGDLMMIKDVPTDEIPSLAGQEDFFVDPLIGTYYINLNCEKECFQDSKVRKALSLAIDRDYVANSLMQGTYSPAGNFMGPGWADPAGGEFIEKSNGGASYIDYDNYEANLEEARQLLADAGYPDGEGFPAITYMINDSGYHRAVAEYLQEAWGQLGIDLSVNIVEWSSFISMRRNGEYDVARNGWVGDYADPSNMLDLLYSTSGNNDGKYNNPEYDAAMEDSRTTLNPEERSAALHQAEDILMADMGCIPLVYYDDFYLQSPKITGAWHSAEGYWYFMYADIVE